MGINDEEAAEEAVEFFIVGSAVVGEAGHIANVVPALAIEGDGPIGEAVAVKVAGFVLGGVEHGLGEGSDEAFHETDVKGVGMRCEEEFTLI